MPNLTRIQSDMVLDPTSGSKVSDQIGNLSKNIIYLANYIPNYDPSAAIYNNCDTALTNAITACKSGGMLILPVGQIFVSSMFTLNNPITIIGAYGSIIENSGYCDCFYVNCNNVHFINVTIENTNYWNSASYSAMESGDYTGIRFHTGTHHLVDKCQILGFSTNIHFENCDFFVVENTLVNKVFNYGIVVENQGNVDSGDSLIHGCIFQGGADNTNPPKALIKYRSGGGLKITDNKLLLGQVGIQTLLPSNVGTGVLIISGNSVEGQSVHCLQMGYETGATNSFFIRTIINGNEFLANNCTGDGVVIDGSIIPNSMTDILFQGNHVTGVPSSLNAVNVNGITNLLISGNEIHGGSNGILIGSYVQNIKVPNDNIILKATSTSIRNIGYAGMTQDQISNICHTSFSSFSNSSKVNAVNTVLASFASSSAQAMFKLTVDVQGKINSPSNEQFYVHQEYLVYNTLNGSNYNSATLISSASTGLPITVAYSSSGIITVTRNDTYADGTYTISGMVKAVVDGMPYIVGINNIGIG